MMSYTVGDASVDLLENTIGDHLNDVAERFPEREALIDAGLPGAAPRRWTYRQLNHDVDSLARALLALDVAAGDRIGIWSANCAEWAILQYASARIGAILVNINPAYRIHELNFVARQNGMRMLVLAPNDRNSDYVSMARAAREESPALVELVFLPGQAHSDPALSLEAGVPAGPGEWSWDELLEEAGNVPDQALARRIAALDCHDPINIQYTSGTTGFPKGATLTHHNILNNAHQIGALLGYSQADKVVIPVPFYHCFGMVIGNLNILSYGGTAIIPGRNFNPAAALQAVQDFGATSLYGVPTMFIAELALENFDHFDLGTLRTGVMAGSTCPVEVMKRVIGEMNMREVAICYGMTETSPVSTMTRTDDTLEQRTQTVGRSMPHVESKIVNPATGEVVERGQIGELCTRGYVVMKGYWNQPDKTAEAIDTQGWMHTADLAVMDEAGYISVEGRIKDMVIRGGENIYPREIEEFLYHHPDIQDVQVIGVPDEKYGEELMACVILRSGVEGLSLSELQQFCRGSLAHFKVPRYLQVRQAFPMTVSGKIRKVAMREEALRELGLEPGTGAAPRPKA